MNSETAINAIDELANWYERPLGCRIKEEIAAHLHDTLSKLAMREALCLGVGGFQQAFAEKQHKWATFFSTLDCSDWLAEADHCLPLKPSSQECIVLAHALDLAKNPQAILRELGRLAADDGHVIIIGFNPWSIAGAYRPFGRLPWRRRGSVPWLLKFFAQGRLRDNLSLLSFETLEIRTFGVSLDSRFAGLQAAMHVFDRVALALLPRCGNVYVLTAKKVTVPLTPISLKWKNRRPALLPGVPGTTAGRST